MKTKWGGQQLKQYQIEIDVWLFTALPDEYQLGEWMFKSAEHNKEQKTQDAKDQRQRSDGNVTSLLLGN